MIKLTISLGLVSFDGHDGLDVDTVIRALDQQLYETKHSGRNKESAVPYNQTL
ncbi:MAG: diguanylate cyclase [Candidatus Omnitrophica bacterium]|nr:diguanylate cyclase [Candidatus Omnitrophota bacterium]MCK5493475.1 diguanylate cyclase [Candidatus Omnitrophota bacterium]